MLIQFTIEQSVSTVVLLSFICSGTGGVTVIQVILMYFVLYGMLL